MNTALAVKSAGNPSPVWEKGRDEGPPFPQKAQRRHIAILIGGSPSPLPLSHPGEGFPATVRSFVACWKGEHNAAIPRPNRRPE